MSKVINVYGVEIDFEAAVALMDANAYEEATQDADPSDHQYFFEVYCWIHTERFDEDFVLNQANPVW